MLVEPNEQVPKDSRQQEARLAMDQFYKRFWREYSPPPPASTAAELTMVYARPLPIEPDPKEQS